MIYSVSMLESVAECDSLLTIAAREKSDLDFRKISLTRQKGNMSETGTEVDQDLTAVTAEVTAYKTIIATLPDGITKEDMVTKLKRAELKVMALTKKDRSNGPISMLTLELEIARTEKEMDELEVFITDIAAKKASI